MLIKLGSDMSEWLLLELQVAIYPKYFFGVDDVITTNIFVTKKKSLEKKCSQATLLKAHVVRLRKLGGVGEGLFSRTYYWRGCMFPLPGTLQPGGLENFQKF